MMMSRRVSGGVSGAIKVVLGTLGDKLLEIWPDSI